MDTLYAAATHAANTGDISRLRPYAEAGGSGPLYRAAEAYFWSQMPPALRPAAVQITGGEFKALKSALLDNVFDRIEADDLD